MKAFQYRLQNVLDIRRVQQNAQVGRHQSAMRKLRQQNRVLHGMRDAVAGVVETAMTAAETMSSRYLKNLDQFLCHQWRMQQRQRTLIVQLQAQEDVERRKLLEARREVRKLEKHAEHKLREWREAYQKEQDKQVDELVVQRFRLSPSDGRSSSEPARCIS